MSTRELDARVETEVMGHSHDYAGCHWCQRDFAGERYVRGNSHFGHYSTDIAAAWKVVEKMVEDGWLVAVTSGPGMALVLIERDSDSHEVQSPTAPEAICLAALRAKGVEV